MTFEFLVISFFLLLSLSEKMSLTRVKFSATSESFLFYILWKWQYIFTTALAKTMTIRPSVARKYHRVFRLTTLKGLKWKSICNLCSKKNDCCSKSLNVAIKNACGIFLKTFPEVLRNFFFGLKLVSRCQKGL